MPDVPALRVKALDHVTLIVDDLERSSGFYIDRLGMQRVARPAFTFDGLWFQAGDTQIHLILRHDQTPSAGQARPPAHAAAGRVFHFAFEVDDARQAARVLTEAGVEIRGGPSLRPDGCVQIWCYDPDGYVVELFSRRAGSVSSLS